MTAQPTLVIGWLILAHLVADFALQTGRIAVDKGSSGRRALRATAVHALIVALCLVPFAVAYGAPGIALVGLVAVTHGVIDRTKVLLTRGAEARAVAAAHRVHERPAAPATLGNAWTPLPAFLFALDQLVHVAISVLAWVILLRTAPLMSGFASWVSSLANGDPVTFHRLVLTGVVLAALAIVNIRAGSLLVAILVRPVLLPGPAHHNPTEAELATPAPPRPASYTVELGPLRGRLQPDVPQTPGFRLASPERVGEAIGILERILIVALVLGKAETAIGLVVAAKTVARFRQLDDRDFAEYYLLGTLCSVLVAVVSALVASAALAT